ncbi:MAG: hypothetical protein IH944_06945 [Armatimonadetes bacterium]|nr:hypothetical protein [Armatimonadota bacterium]
MRTEPNKKGKRRIWWVVAATLTVFLFVSFVFDPFGSMGLKGELAKARAAGFPVEPEDIFLDSAPRDKDNAALLFDQMVSIVESSRGLLYGEDLHVRAVIAGYDDFDIEEVNKYFEAIVELLLLAELAAELPEYRAYKDWSNPVIILIPEFAIAKQVSKALAVRAMLSLEDGEVDAALVDLRRMLQIANHMDQSGFWIGHLVAIAIRSIYTDAIEYTAALPEASGAFVDGALSQLEYWPRRTDWSQTLRSEAYSGVWIPQNMEQLAGAGYGFFWAWRDGIPGDEGEWEDASVRLQSTQSKATQLTLKHWIEILNTYDQDDDELITWARGIDDLLPSGTGFWHGAEALVRFFSIEMEWLATSEVRMRARREVLKSSLEALLAMRNSAQDPFENIGLDPFTGASLLYKKTKDGFVIYSVGEDSVDDGGQAVRTSGHSDIVFEYPKKRKPAPPDFYTNGF